MSFNLKNDTKSSDRRNTFKKLPTQKVKIRVMSMNGRENSEIDGEEYKDQENPFKLAKNGSQDSFD